MLLYEKLFFFQKYGELLPSAALLHSAQWDCGSVGQWLNWAKGVLEGVNQ